MPRKIVSGAGCCLVDMLFNDINFSSTNVKPYLSVKRGDGGLTPGHLVFREEFEKFCGKPFEKVLGEITGGRKRDKINIGGPSIVSLINIAQLIDKDQCEVPHHTNRNDQDKDREDVPHLHGSSRTL